MSRTSITRNTLFRLYERYVGEPDSKKDVWGYWIFILGYVVGMAGIFTSVVGYAGSADAYYYIRIAGVTAASGLALSLFGIVLMLPVRKRGIQASVVGLGVALVGVAAFGIVYPYNWRELGTDYSVEVITIYTTGIAIIAGVTALVPVVTGRKGMFVEEEGKTEEPAVLTGDSLHGAQFAVFRDEANDWRWNVLHLEALAESVDSAVDRSTAKAGIERVRSKISSAGLLELTTSAFRLYEDRDGIWQWTLVRDDGSVVGSCSADFDEREAAEQSVSFLKDRGPVADVIEIDNAAFTVSSHRDRWHWQLVDDGRRPLARSEGGFSTQSAAESAPATFAERFTRARLIDVTHFGAELRAEDGKEDAWFWRLVDENDAEIVRSVDVFADRRDAEERVETVLSELRSASITVAGEPSYELFESGEDWYWRLVDGNEHVVARSPDGSGEHTATDRQIERFSDAVLDADVAYIDDAEYEVYPSEPVAVEDRSEERLPVTADGGVEVDTGGEGGQAPASKADWQWRLVTDDREIIAGSTEVHESAEAAEQAIERVRDQAAEADLIEFENAAFQVYEADSSEWRWRLIDEDGTVLADSGEEHTTRTEATEAMMTLKEQAPDAELLEIDTAAFELFVDENDEWGWRLVDEAGTLVAEDPATHPTRDAAHDAMNRLLDKLDASVRTMDRAIFQPFARDEWHWRFVLPAGDVVAISGGAGDHPASEAADSRIGSPIDGYATRDELTADLESVRRTAAVGETYTIGSVYVQVYGNGDWQFRLLDRDRTPLADSTISFDDHESAIETVRAIEQHAVDVPVFSIEDAAIRLEELPADKSDGTGDGSDDDSKAPAADADRKASADAATESTRWHWQLIDRDRTVVARSAHGEPTKAAVKEAVEDVRHLAPIAGRVDFDVASFELFVDAADRWRWRLIDEDGVTVATGAETYDNSDAVHDALSDVRSVIESASILEIDNVSFELHADDDEWIWRLVDEYGETMSRSTQTYETRTEAREAMNAIKSHAPDGWITFTEN